MGPAIALRLRQHLTLTPQVQQALRLLQMSAMEFAQEMEQALSANAFLEDNDESTTTTAASEETPEVTADGEAPPAESPAESPIDYEGRLPQEQSSSGSGDRDREEWSGVSDTTPTLQDHLRQQLLISPMSERDRALAHMIVDSLDDAGLLDLTRE